MATATLLPLLLLALLRAAVVQKLPQVKLYLWVEFWGNLLLFLAHDYFGWESLPYTLLYIIGQLAVFSSFLRIVKHEATVLNLVIFTTLWGSVGYFVFGHIAHRADLTHAIAEIVIVTAAVLYIALAMALGIAVPHSTHRQTYGTLVLLWLALGAYNFGFILYPGNWIWVHWSAWMRGLLCLAGFGWLAIHPEKWSAGRELNPRPTS